MFQKKIILKKKTKMSIYTNLCNKMERQGNFVACGSGDDKWIIGKWKDGLDFAAWLVANGLLKLSKNKEKSNNDKGGSVKN